MATGPQQELSASTARAIGAATVPPKPPCESLDGHGDRHLRVVGRGEGDEPRLVRLEPGDADLGGAGLAGDLDARQLRGRAGALLDDACHHLRSAPAAVEGFIDLLTARAARCVLTVRPSGSTIAVGEVRRHQLAAVGDRGDDHRHLQRRDRRACPGRSPCGRRRLVGSSAASRPPVSSARRWRSSRRPGSRAAACGRSRSASCTWPSCRLPSALADLRRRRC